MILPHTADSFQGRCGRCMQKARNDETERQKRERRLRQWSQFKPFVLKCGPLLLLALMFSSMATLCWIEFVATGGVTFRLRFYGRAATGVLAGTTIGAIVATSYAGKSVWEFFKSKATPNRLEPIDERRSNL